MNPDDSYREKIGERITLTLADALEEGAITGEEASKVAEYVLENIDKAKTSGEILDFLTDLANKWPVFGQLLTIELGQATAQKEDAALKKTEELLKENKIDEALETVEEANKDDRDMKGGRIGSNSS